MDALPPFLLDLLSNPVVLRHTVPYLPVSSLLSLAATNTSFQELINTQPEIWRHLSLTRIKSAIVDCAPIDVGGILWRAERMDESLTEDDFYAGPLRGIFGRLHQQRLLQYVHTLVLDGLSVPADLVREIVCGDRYNVRILSVREAKNLNHMKLQQVLRYIVRPTRPEGTPKLRALYVFGPGDVPRLHNKEASSIRSTRQQSTNSGVTTTPGAQIGAQWNQPSTTLLTSSLAEGDQARWYGRSGRVLRRPQSAWPDTLQTCRNIIHFDAVLCRGPRHDITKTSSIDYLPPTIATVALGPCACEVCGSSPEGPATYGESPDSTLPLLAPPPIHTASLRAAQRPEQVNGALPGLLLRCEDCLRGRWCERCGRFWCEDCYVEPKSRVSPHVDIVDLSSMTRNQLTGQEAGSPIKVYLKLCVEHCMIDEMRMSTDGFWG